MADKGSRIENKRMNTYEDVDVIIYVNIKTMYYIIFKSTQ